MSITLTDSLVKRIKALRQSAANPGLKLRLQVDGGGCQGFEYRFELTDKTTADDEIFEKDGVQVVIDSLSLPFLKNAEIDFAESLLESHFQVNNPNAASSCGCGSSFSISR